MDGLLSHKLMTAGAQDSFLQAWERWYQARAIWEFECSHSPSGNFDEPNCLAAARLFDSAREALLYRQPLGRFGIAAAAHVLWDDDVKYWAQGRMPAELSLSERLKIHLVPSIWRAASGCDGLPPDFCHLDRKGA